MHLISHCLACCCTLQDCSLYICHVRAYARKYTQTHTLVLQTSWRPDNDLQCIVFYYSNCSLGFFFSFFFYCLRYAAVKGVKLITLYQIPITANQNNPRWAKMSKLGNDMFLLESPEGAKFACSPHMLMVSLQVLWLLPTDQRHSFRRIRTPKCKRELQHIVGLCILAQWWDDNLSRVHPASCLKAAGIRSSPPPFDPVREKAIEDRWMIQHVQHN